MSSASASSCTFSSILLRSGAQANYHHVNVPYPPLFATEPDWAATLSFLSKATSGEEAESHARDLEV